MTYTLGQAMAFTEAAARDEARRERAREAAVATAVRSAMGLEPGAWVKYLDGLRT